MAATGPVGSEGNADGRLQKQDGTLSIRAERFERMNIEEPIPELRQPA